MPDVLLSDREKKKKNLRFSDNILLTFLKIGFEK